MGFEDFKRMHKVVDTRGTCHEGSSHEVEITGTPTNPVVACRTHGCTVYYYGNSFYPSEPAQPERLTGNLGSASAGGVECTFTITHDGKKKQILCEIVGPEGYSTTGSWTANDTGPPEEGGEEGPPPRR